MSKYRMMGVWSQSRKFNEEIDHRLITGRNIMVNDDVNK